MIYSATFSLSSLMISFVLEYQASKYVNDEDSDGITR